MRGDACQAWPMSKSSLPLIGLLLIAAAPAQAPPKPPLPPLTGNWAGDGFALRVAPTGFVIQGKCASGMITDQIVPDKTGAFTATGYYNPYSSGYRLSDLAPRDKLATFKGKVNGNTLVLTMGMVGRPDESRYVLRRGAAVKFGRCG
jgi:hypothetical protein